MQALMEVARAMWHRDKAIFRNIQRPFVYSYYRFEHFRLTATRARMQKIRYIDKDQMRK